jgi:hypothetical protein
MATVNQVFQSAPMGRRLIYAMAFSVVALLVVFGVNFYVAEFRLSPHVAPGAKLMQIVAPLIGFLFLIPSFLFERSRMSRFRIEDNVLVLGRKRYSMPGLVEVGRDPDVLRRAIKLFGNGGLGSIRGKFRSKRLGVFYAFLTDTQTAVVLKWPDKTVAVSPADPEFFIYSARQAAGLR